jgi:hypothetical protein
MTQYDDIRKFAGTKVEEKKEDLTPTEKKLMINEIIHKLCDEGRFPEHYYRSYLRGYYDSSREFIRAICIHQDIPQHKVLIKYHEYALQVLEKTTDAESTKIYEENGIRNFHEIGYKACINTINIMLKAQRNIIRDLDSPNIEVSLEATKLAVKIMGKKMASYVEKLDDITSEPALAVNDDSDQKNIDQQQESSTAQEVSG